MPLDMPLDPDPGCTEEPGGLPKPMPQGLDLQVQLSDLSSH